MAITRTQIAKQLLAQGGRTGFQGGGADLGAGASGMGSGGRDRDKDRADTREQRSVASTMGTSPRSVSDLGIERDTGLERARQRNINLLDDFKSKRPKVNVPGLFGRLLKKPIQKFANFSARKNRPFFEEVIRAGKIPGLNFATVANMTPEELEQQYDNYMSARLSGEIDAFGNLLNQGDDSSPLLRTGIMAQAPKEDEEDPFFPNFRLMAEGGRADLQDGGLANIARQELVFGGVADAIGKGLKKATRAIKKIAKSPIGKAALLYAGGSYLSGKGLFGNLKGAGFLKTVPATIKAQAAAAGLSPREFMMGMGGKTPQGPGGILGFIQKNPMLSIFGASAAAGLMTPKDKEIKTTDFGPDIDDPELIMRYPELYYNMRQFAEGGSTDKEPVAKKTMPLLDMGGKEMDLREEGGFVPIGRMEKADDVPARLSKNEFVFTADAVRNAGDGDVDKGAEVMYNMMKNLEAGGEVSEESQGLEGARKMFQTSQRLEEVL